MSHPEIEEPTFNRRAESVHPLLRIERRPETVRSCAGTVARMAAPWKDVA